MSLKKRDKIIVTPETVPNPGKKKTNNKVQEDNKKMDNNPEEINIEPKHIFPTEELKFKPYPVRNKKKERVELEESKKSKEIAVVKITDKQDETTDAKNKCAFEEAPVTKEFELKEKKKKRNKTITRRVAKGAAVAGATALTACVFFPAAPFVFVGAGGIAGASEYKIHKKNKRVEKRKKEREAKAQPLQHQANNNLVKLYKEEDEQMEQFRKERNSHLSVSQEYAFREEFFQTDPDVDEKPESGFQNPFEDGSEEFDIFSRHALPPTDVGEIVDLRDPEILETKLPEPPQIDAENKSELRFVEFTSTSDDINNADKEKVEKRNKRCLNEAYEAIMAQQEALKQDALKEKQTKSTERKEQNSSSKKKFEFSNHTIQAGTRNIFLSSDDDSSDVMEENYFKI